MALATQHMSDFFQRIDVIVVIGDILPHILQAWYGKLQLCGGMAPVDIAAGVVAQLQQKGEEILKILLILESKAQSLALVDDVLIIVV